MKKAVFTITLFLVTTISFAQDYKTNIKTEFSEYLHTIINKEFEKSMNYIVPEFFEFFPKSQMIEMMDQLFNNPEMEFELKDAEIKTINDAQKIEDKYYAFLTYSNQMNIKFLLDDEGEEQTADEKKMYNNIMMLSFEKTFGEGNVNYDEETEFYEIYVEKDVYAVSVNGKTDWKFLVIEKGQQALLSKILPKELADTLE